LKPLMLHGPSGMLASLSASGIWGVFGDGEKVATVSH
jgi:hypothetical protein